MTALLRQTRVAAQEELIHNLAHPAFERSKGMFVSPTARISLVSGSALLVLIVVLLYARSQGVIQYIWIGIIPAGVLVQRLRAKRLSRLDFREPSTLAEKAFARKLDALKGVGTIFLFAGSLLIIMPAGAQVDVRSVLGAFVMVVGFACILLNNYLYHDRFLVDWR